MATTLARVAVSRRKKARLEMSRASLYKSGGVLLSHTVARAVPSAQRSLTTVFGMGTGVASSQKPPENYPADAERQAGLNI